MTRALFIYVSFFGVIMMNAQTTNSAPYCVSGYTSTSSYPEISKVELFSPYTSLVNISIHTPAPGYTYYNNLQTCTLVPLSVHSLTITLKNVDIETMLKVWVDYNANNVFENTELIMSVSQGSVGTGIAVVKTGTFQIPVSAPWFTSTRMRVSLGWHYANWSSNTFSLDACHTPTTGDGSAGETEDYNVYTYATEGIYEFNGDVSPLMFPNPAHDLVNVPSVIQEQTEHYELIDRLGRKIISSNEFPMGVSELPRDLYYLKLCLKNGSVLNSKLQVD